MVTVLAGIGMPEDKMVDAILNPQTGKPITPVTLRKHFKEELQMGFVQANAKVMAGLFNNATTPTDAMPGGNVASQIFWAKCRMGWQQNPEKHKPDIPAAIANDSSDLDVARRLAFLFAKAAR